MTKSARTQRWLAVLPRAAADLAAIHIAMLLAFAVSIIYQSAEVPVSRDLLIDGFRAYYIRTFLPLSLLFPGVFFANGLYARVRSYQWADKLRVFATSCLVAVPMFIATEVVLLGVGDSTGRSVILPFTVFSLAGLAGIRFLKEWILRVESLSDLGQSHDGEAKMKSVTGDDEGLVLVLGGAGYIGCWLVRRLLEENHRVRILDSAVYGLDAISDLLTHPKLEFVEGDCRNIQDVVRAMRNVASVVHLAAIVGDPACEIDHQTTVEINYAATRMIVEIAKGNGVKRFLFASSCSVYGATDEVMDEMSFVNPISLYGRTKVASEQALMEAQTPSFQPVLMRFATVFGLSNRPRFDLVVNLLSAKAKQDRVITIFNGQQWRPFVHVKDLAEAIILLLDADIGKVGGQVFNVGDNRYNHTLADVADVVQKVFPGTRVEHVENQDRRNYRVDFTKIERTVGYQARYSVEDGVRQIKDAFENGELATYKDTRFSNAAYLRDLGALGYKADADKGVMSAFGGELAPSAGSTAS